MNNNETIQPHRPQQVSKYAESCLLALSAQGLGKAISLGGAFGLAHYYEYRPTHDVDAWWMPETTAEERQQVVQTIQDALRSFGEVQVRTWGDVVSVELRQEGRAVFSFQVAHRSAQLAPPQPVPWMDGWLDSFPDLLAAKMVALVERGAPRDFRDIYMLCHADMTTAEQCWALWQQRQQLAGSDTDATMPTWIDGTLYPDMEPPDTLETLADQVDFLSRLCAAWDFGVLPYPETVTEVRRPEWRGAVEACRLLTSPAYHLLRAWHNLETLPYLGARLAYISEDPNLKYI